MLYTFKEIDQLFDDLDHDAKVGEKRNGSKLPSDQGTREAGKQEAGAS